MIDGCEVIVTGSGIGFQKHVGDALNQEKIEKIYAFSDRHRLQFLELLQHCPHIYFQISEMIIHHAESVMKRKLRDWLVITLTDHIYFAVERARKGELVPNLMLDEVRTLYRQEYKLGLWALKLIKARTGVLLNAGEAAYIAIHIINASESEKQDQATQILIFSQYMVRIIEDCFQVKFSKENMNYARLMIHLKFLGQRVLYGEKSELVVPFEPLYQLVENQEQLKRCLTSIRQFIMKRYQYDLSESEEFYLSIHLMRILS